jgi:DnaK suppressor protein
LHKKLHVRPHVHIQIGAGLTKTLMQCKGGSLQISYAECTLRALCPPSNEGVMMSLQDADVVQLKALLMDMARNLSGQDEALRAMLQSEDSQTSNTFVAGAEAAVSAETDEEVLAMLQHEQQEAREVKEALQRLQEGSYGLCAQCGEPIGRARLFVVPQASMCMPCQEYSERVLARH